MKSPSTNGVEASPLFPILTEEIRQTGGMIPFRRFMELALYHPAHGYYASGRARVGKAGDFFTSVSVGRIYGRLLASVGLEAWERLGQPAAFTVVEQGANDGTMAADLLGAVREIGGVFAKNLRYQIVEPFAMNRTRQQEKLSAFPYISWHDSNYDLSEFTGLHLSNELLDAFPVDSLRWNGAAWEEECVSGGDDAFGWNSRAIRDPQLSAATQRLPSHLPQGWRFEINRGIAPWLAEISSRLTRGLILTIDYGQSGEDRFAPHRSDGTLLSYRNHQRFEDPLPEPGLRDITAQVDFSDLATKAEGAGFSLLGYSDQHHFLVGAAEPWMRTLGDLTAASEAAKPDLRALQTLLSPVTMGRQFKAIALNKNFPSEPPLACFRYQRPGIALLEQG